MAKIQTPKSKAGGGGGKASKLKAFAAEGKKGGTFYTSAGKRKVDTKK